MKVKFELLDAVANNFYWPDIKLGNFSIENPLSTSPGDDNFPVALPEKYQNYAEEIKELEVFPDDIWVVTYPKCGTTLAQEAVWQICNGVTLNASGLTLPTRFPFLEFCAFITTEPTTIEKVKTMTRPRFIKSHLPPHLLPKQLWSVKPKIIFVLREPKDTAISYYHHNVNIAGWKGSKDEFMQIFLVGNVAWGDFWLHTISIWKLRNESNVKLVRFEDLKENIRGTVTELVSFLEKSLTDSQLEHLLEHLNFKNMKNNPLVNMDEMVTANKKMYGLEQSEFSFIRKGKVGSYKEEMSEEFVKLFDNKTNQQFQEFDIKWN